MPIPSPNNRNGPIMAMENELVLRASKPALSNQTQQMVQAIIPTIQAQGACIPFAEISNRPCGVMLASSTRLYVDVSNLVENATAETTNPTDLVAHQRAGERHLLNALPAALQRCGLQRDAAFLHRIVLDYCGHFCGAHLNVSTQCLGPADIVPYIVPFIVTRYYACAGGWSPTGFVMSQKGRAMHTTASQDTRDKRAIVHLKDEPHAAAPHKRIHLTSADATMSELGTYLTAGCTALILHMLDAGVCVGPAMTLLDPIAALRQLDTDLFWSRPLPLKCGAYATPLEIQLHYLLAAEAYTSGTCAPWMKQVVSLWRETLKLLRNAPGQLTTRLDPFIKLRLYAKALATQGLSMDDFTKWCGVVAQLAPHIDAQPIPRRNAREFLRERLPYVPFLFLEERIKRRHLSWSDIPRAFALWHAMLDMDHAYHRIDDQGLYWKLRASGAVDSHIVTEEQIAHAMEHGPRDTRARPREAAIRDLLLGEKGFANWSSIWSATRRMNLPDPHAGEGRWEPINQPQTASIAVRRPMGRR